MAPRRQEQLASDAGNLVRELFQRQMPQRLGEKIQPSTGQAEPGVAFRQLLGGAFGVTVMSLLQNQRAAQQIFPFLIFPQFFLAGIFNPIKVLPWYLAPFSLISPMRYAVDLLRGVVYTGRPEYDKIVLFSPLTNLVVMAAMFTGFLVLGTALFVRQETNR